jgi:hemerythrin
MESLVWRESYSVGVKELDEQHKVFLEMINALSELDPVKVNTRELFAALNKLVVYAEVHFKTEERYLKKYGYPKLAQQELEHAAFTTDVFKLAESLQTKGPRVFNDVVSFTKNWYRSHILGSDREYMEFLVAKGAR